MRSVAESSFDRYTLSPTPEAQAFMRAMRKEPQHRYGSVDQFMADIRRSPPTFTNAMIPGTEDPRDLYGNWFYGAREFPVVQLIWPDKAGRFPDDPASAAEFRARVERAATLDPTNDQPSPATGFPVVVSIYRGVPAAVQRRMHVTTSALPPRRRSPGPPGRG